jgi:hypothetical protein
MLDYVCGNYGQEGEGIAAYGVHYAEFFKYQTTVWGILLK